MPPLLKHAWSAGFVCSILILQGLPRIDVSFPTAGEAQAFINGIESGSRWVERGLWLN
jgi:hypothetical protein